MAESKNNKHRVSDEAQATFKEVARSTEIFDHTQYRDFLGAVYSSIKNAYPQYSYLAFASDLGFPKTNAIWMVITGRRKLSPKAVDRVLQSLKLKNAHRRYFLAMVKHNNANKSEEREKLLTEMIDIKATVIDDHGDRQALEYFSEWYFPVIREMIALEGFKSDPQWISEQLFMKVMPKQVSHALELLEKLDLIRYDEDLGRHVQTGGQVRPNRNVGSIAAVRYHEKMCEIAKDSVTRVPSALRDLNAVTVRLSENDAKAVRKKIFELCELVFELEEKSEIREGDNIYQINMQVFPLITPKK